MATRTICWMVAVICGCAGWASARQIVAEWDFTKGAQGWHGNDRARVQATEEGLAVRSTGEDPWIEGPAFDAPTDGMLEVTIRMRSTADSGGEVFYGPGFTAERSRRFVVQTDGQMHEYSLILPRSTGAGTRLRLDPCHGEGELLVQSITVESIAKPAPPRFSAPPLPANRTLAETVRSGPVTLRHAPDARTYAVEVDGHEMARGYDAEMIGIATGDGVEWLSLREADVRVRQRGRALTATARMHDHEGATWTVERTFRKSASAEGFEVETTIRTSRDRDALLLPWLTLLPGAGSFGTAKDQAVFAGLEYLADEPSSSTKDLEGEAHVRRTPDPVKITLPLMAICRDGRYLGLIWEPGENVAAGFDSPDRVFHSGGHAMWLSAPAVGTRRFENDLIGHTPIALEADRPLTQRAWIVGGAGRSIVPAVQDYVRIHGLPDLPRFEGGLDAAERLLAHGWLDSACNVQGRFRHAVWGSSFGPAPAADAAMFMRRLSLAIEDETLSARLDSEVEIALSRLSPGDPFASAISHVRPPAAPLVFGRMEEYAAMRQRQAEAQLRRFDENGLLHYTPGDVDYGRTHFADHANGLGGLAAASILEGAALSGNAELIEKAVALLDKQTRLYAHTVPRGAQTWEVPLHTPDILASAHMVKAYTLGHILTGRRDLLEQARYWAWTGVPFVYLQNPTGGSVGTYATIAVLGATNWKAPVWLGQPVQWCGLVYGSALYDLAEVDPEGPWEQIARGISIAGLQMTWPTTDKERQGLLPDFYHLRMQVSDGPAINPGTVGAHLWDAYESGSIYDLRRLDNGWIVHAPCRITVVRGNPQGADLKLDGWGDQTYSVLLSGLRERPAGIVAQEGQLIESEWHSDSGRAVLTLRGPCRLTLR